MAKIMQCDCGHVVRGETDDELVAKALMVYDRLGLTILKRTWFNVDLIWAGALVGSEEV